MMKTVHPFVPSTATIQDKEARRVVDALIGQIKLINGALREILAKLGYSVTKGTMDFITGLQEGEGIRIDEVSKGTMKITCTVKPSNGSGSSSGAGEGEEMTVMTAWRINLATHKFQVKTRSITAAPVGDESDWTDVLVANGGTMVAGVAAT
jgi:hypothetical protein